MKTTSALILLTGLLLAGCTKDPVPAPPPKADGDPVVPTPVNPIPPTPATNTPPANTTNTPPANTNTPPKPVNIDEQIKRLATDDRQAAAVSLATAGKSAVPALVKALDHQDWQVRAAAVFALGQIGPDAAEAKDRLQTVAEKDENTSVRDAAAFALDAIAEKSTK